MPEPLKNRFSHTIPRRIAVMISVRSVQ